MWMFRGVSSVLLALSLGVASSPSMVSAQEVEGLPGGVSVLALQDPSASFLPPLALSRSLAAAADQWALAPVAGSLAPARDIGPGSRGALVGEWARVLHDRGFAVMPVAHGEAPEWPTQVDEDLLAGIRSAQLEYGLPADGHAGAYLRANLNADPQQTAAEFDAWRLFVDDAAATARAGGYRHVLFVNIPSFTLHAVDLWTGETVLESRVVVGMPTRKTPRFSTHVVGLKYNPDWSPPPSLLARGRHYMPPGPANPLGMLRFSTDNASHIYLHDTNEPELFEETNRARSSGCIRVQDWKVLASIVSGQSEEDIDAKIGAGRTYNESISPVLVLTTYSLVDVVAGRPGRYVDVYGLGPMKPPVLATGATRAP